MDLKLVAHVLLMVDISLKHLSKIGIQVHSTKIEIALLVPEEPPELLDFV